MTLHTQTEFSIPARDHSCCPRSLSPWKYAEELPDRQVACWKDHKTEDDGEPAQSQNLQKPLNLTFFVGVVLFSIIVPKPIIHLTHRFFLHTWCKYDYCMAAKFDNSLT